MNKDKWLTVVINECTKSITGDDIDDDIDVEKSLQKMKGW